MEFNMKFKKITQREAIDTLLKLKACGPEAELLRDLAASGPREAVTKTARKLADLGLIQQYEDMPAFELAEACIARPSNNSGLWRSGDSIVHECLKAGSIAELAAKNF